MRGIHVMRTVKILLALLLFAVLAGVVTADSSQAAKKGNYEYIKCKGGVQITKYTGKDKNVILPDRIAGQKVVKIGRDAFYCNKKIKKVTIPDTVKTIDAVAFEECENLKEVKLPKNLKEIGYDAFSYTGLTQIYIPDSVKKIGSDAFASCKRLKKVHLGENVKEIKAMCFEQCTQLETINLENIEEIDGYAFSGDKSLTGVLNLDSVTKIDLRAFYGCEGIKEVHFSDALQRLGNKNDNPFAYCTGIEKFTIPAENGNYTSVDGVIYGKTDNSLVAWPARKAEAAVLGSNVRKIYDYACSGAAMTSVAMEGEVNYIGKEAFAKSLITEAYLPLPDCSRKTKWDYEAFNECRMLAKVVFPDKSVSSNNIAFIHCNALREVVLPGTMQELSVKMFLGCTALESITVPEAVTTIPMGCFFNCRRLNSINLDNIQFIDPAAFSHCSSLSGTLTLNVQKISGLSFEKCTGIKEVKFTKPLGKVRYRQSTYFTEEELQGVSSEVNNCYYLDKRFESSPFAGCTALTAISVPEGGETRTIDGVLYSADMKELIAYPAALDGKFNIPHGVENICSSAFQDSALTELVTANSVRKISYHAVKGSSIKSITISKGVNDIVTDALDGCGQLESIEVHASNKKFESDDGVLYEKKAKGRLLLYPSARKGAKYTVRKKAQLALKSFNNCKYLKKVIIPEGLKKGREVAFYNCSNIKLYLPESMKLYKGRNYFEEDGRKQLHAFHKSCTGCVMVAKKNSKLAKYFDKSKIKYKTY